MIDLKPPLAVLAQRMLWEQIEKSLGPSLAHKSQLGKEISEADLFGPIVAVTGVGISNACRQKLSIRLIASLLYLKHSNNFKDEAAVEFWSGNVFWQHFISMEYYELKLPCDAT
jgi:IS5 family transposase